MPSTFRNWTASGKEKKNKLDFWVLDADLAAAHRRRAHMWCDSLVCFYLPLFEWNRVTQNTIQQKVNQKHRWKRTEYPNEVGEPIGKLSARSHRPHWYSYVLRFGWFSSKVMLPLPLGMLHEFSHNTQSESLKVFASLHFHEHRLTCLLLFIYHLFTHFAAAFSDLKKWFFFIISFLRCCCSCGAGQTRQIDVDINVQRVLSRCCFD